MAWSCSEPQAGFAVVEGSNGSSLEEIGSTIKQNAENVRQASQLAAGSREAAEKGGQVVNAAALGLVRGAKSDGGSMPKIKVLIVEGNPVA